MSYLASAFNLFSKGQKKFVPDPGHELNWLQALSIHTVFDIGAHVGESARQFRKLWPSAHIYSFEPLPDAYKLLIGNLSGDSNFSSFNIALGNSNTLIDMRANEFAPSSSILPITKACSEAFPFTRHTKLKRIGMRRLDEVASSLQIQAPILIKLDVQGYEDRVIAGGIETFKRATIVIIEVSFVQLYKGQPLFADIYNQLREMGLVYSGALHQLVSPEDGRPLQADAVFIRSPDP